MSDRNEFAEVLQSVSSRRRLNSTPLLNRKAVRALLLDLAKRRAHKFTRVSDKTLEMLNARIRVACVDHVGRLPSMGKTI